MVKKEIIIIGAGASGLMAAGRYKNRDIALLEANAKPAQKIMISGGGKCNITNKKISPDHYLGEQGFIKQVLQEYGQHALLADFKKQGLDPVLRKENQYFCKNSASELVSVLMRACKDIPIFYNHKVHAIEKKKDFIITTDKGVFEAQKVVVATGGLSYPKIGASDIAFKIAEYFGHTIHRLNPALVGFTLQKEQFWMKELSGISLPVKIQIESKKIQDDLLFAHRGISGPAILNSSLYWKRGEIEIDFAPNTVLNETFFCHKKQISTALKLPKRFTKAFLDAIGLVDQPLFKLDTTEQKKLQRLKSYRFAPAGNFGYTKAEVTSGGIATDEIDVDTMMSQKCKGLYFLGECLDVTGELGGYNFQWAFSTAQRLTV